MPHALQPKYFIALAAKLATTLKIQHLNLDCATSLSHFGITSFFVHLHISTRGSSNGQEVYSHVIAISCTHRQL